MHAEQLAYMRYPQLDGEASFTNESVYRNYPHPRPVAIEDLSVKDREILNSIVQGRRARGPDRRGKTRRYAAIFDEKGLPLPSATGVVIGGARSSVLEDGPESEMEKPIIIRHNGSEKPTCFRALGRKISSAARSVFTCHHPD